jgi:6-methylsalicylate decarboxylase
MVTTDTTPPPPPRRRIDVHHHFYSPGWKEAERAWAARRGAFLFPANRDWTPEKSLEDMERGGVTQAVLSLASIPDNWFGGDPAQAAALAHECNEYALQMSRDHPGKFGLFCSLPMIDVEASLREIQYGAEIMKCDGFGLCSSYGDKWPGDPLFRPVFEELNRRKAVVYFHPTTPGCCRGLVPGVGGDAVLEVPFDTSRAVASLLVSGTMHRSPDTKFVFPHSGGSLPSLVGRMSAFMDKRQDAANFAPDGVEAVLKRLYFDTANGAWPGAMAGLLTLVPFSHIMFGSDFPYFTAAMTAAGLARLGYSDRRMAAIDSGTALKLLPRLKRLR